MSDHAFHPDTLAIHAGQVPDRETGARALPIYQTTSYVFDSAEHAASLFNLQTFGNVYSRLSNPTVAALEERVAALEGGRAAVAASSGMAAEALALMTILQAGDHVVAAGALYGGTVTMLSVSLAKFGVETSFVDATRPEAFAAAGDALDAIAGKVYRLGDHAGPGSTVKMVNQLLAGVHIATACEAMALGMRAGADPKQLYEVICNSAGNSWMFQNRVPHILDGDYTPLSAVNIFIKDLGIVLDAARALKFPLPLAAQAHQLYLATAAAGHGAEDDSAVVKFYAQLAGLTLPGAST